MNGWKFVLFIQLLTNLVIVFDIPIARQIIVFINLTFIPGIVLIQLFELKELDSAQTWLFSVGFSVIFWMLLGLLINEVFPFFGVPYPFSTLPLLVIMNLVMTTFLLIGYSFKKNFSLFSKIQNIPPLISIFFFLPFLSIVGTFLVNNRGDNLLLLFLILAISGLVLAYVLSWRIKKFSKYDSFMLMMIVLSLLLHTSLITNYVVGFDVYREFYVFRVTENSLRWNSSSVSTNFAINKVNGMLSVTILPTIYSQMLKIEENFLFKFLYPFILSWLAIGLYKLYRTQFDERLSFLSVFFFTANSVFFTLFSSRQMVAELFFILLFLVLFNKKLSSPKKELCYLIFSAGLVMSHYSMSYVFIFLIFVIWAYQLIRKRTKLVTTSQLLSIFVLASGWYIFTSGASTFNDLLNAIQFVYRNLSSDFFNPQARSTLVLTALGAGQADSIIQQVGRMLFYLSEFVIIVGFVTLLIKRKERRAMNEGFVMLLFLNITLLLMSIIVPNFAATLGITRFYQIALLTLAPLCIVGGNAIFNLIGKQRFKPFIASTLLILYLIAFFLFQTGFVYAITGDVNWSLPLSIRRGEVENPALYDRIISKPEVFGVQWFHEKALSNWTVVYADIVAVRHLTAYGMIPYENVRELSNVTTISDRSSHVYLRRFNVIDGIIQGANYVWDSSDFSYLFNDMNKIYSNGVSESYMSVPHNAT